MPSSDAVLINATLNCLGILIRTRPSIANKILSAILNFNPLKQANSPMTPKLKVIIKSMERTTKALLMNINKRFVVCSFLTRSWLMIMQESYWTFGGTNTTVPRTHQPVDDGYIP